MHRILSCSVVILMLFSLLWFPVFAWEYPDGSSDAKFEAFGPRADSLLIKLYSDEALEWGTGLEGGEIDLTDTRLDREHYDKYSSAPWNSTLKVCGYGVEYGLYVFDLNNNNNTYLGNPPDPAYANPVYPNPMGYTTAESGIIHDNGYPLRHAIAHLVNRTKITEYAGTEVTTPIYTPVPPCFGEYTHPEIDPNGTRVDLTHPYDPSEAATILNEASVFPIGPDGWRYWDRNRNGWKDEGEELVLKLVARMDHLPRLYMGALLRNELQSSGVKIHVNLMNMTKSQAITQWMDNKDAHIYTAGWSLNLIPDHLIIWNWNYYWHPGQPYNTGGCNKDTFNQASNDSAYATDKTDAIAASRTAQEAFCDAVLGITMYSNNDHEAMSRTYAGPESGFAGQNWTGVVKWPSYGIDNSYSFLNIHTTNTAVGGTTRYGFRTTSMGRLNPVYASNLWSNKVLDLIGYESLLARNPYTMELMPWVAEAFNVSTYVDRTSGITCTKIAFTLRNDVFFQDGIQLTAEDVYFTFVQLDDILASRSLPGPWWMSNVEHIRSFRMLDPLNFEVLLDCQSLFAIDWIGSNRILPKHIWKPICEGAIAPKSGLPWDPTSFAPDPNLIGSGAWRLDEYVPDTHILLVANKPGSVVDTDVTSDPNANSQAINSTKGFFRFRPVYAGIYTQNHAAKLGLPHRLGYWPTTNEMMVNFTTEVSSLWLNQSSGGKLLVTKHLYVDGSLCSGYPLNLTLETLANGTILSQREWLNITLPKGIHEVKLAVHVTGPQNLTDTNPSSSNIANPWVGQWTNTTLKVWITVTEDIYGPYYVDPSLRAPDIAVDIRDLAWVCKGFGSYPGHPSWERWGRFADVNRDDRVDIKDVLYVARLFGWNVN